jgi:hypothetical protein
VLTLLQTVIVAFIPRWSPWHAQLPPACANPMTLAAQSPSERLRPYSHQ